MNLREAIRQLQANILAGNATVIRSDPGGGKTEAMAKVVKWFRALHAGKRVGVGTSFMATQSPIGATGLPWKAEKTWRSAEGKDFTYTMTDPAVPQWFMAKCVDTGAILPASLVDYVFLILEEWGQGSAETKRAFAEVLRAGGTPPYYLPEGSPRVALSNYDARDGVTKEFDFIINRANWLHVTGDAKIWVEDFADLPYR